MTPRQLAGGALVALATATLLVRHRSGSLRAFAAEVGRATAQREAELRLALGVDAGGVPAEAARRLVQAPTAAHDEPFPG